jgi:uncharacterized damage-inducible protein DinB
MTDNSHGGVSVVNTLFAHNAWANLKLLNFCEQLSDAQLDTATVGGYGTIRDTLVHIIGGEISYVKRTNGRMPPTPLQRGQLPSFAVLKEAATWASDEMLQLALSAQSDTVVEERDDTSKAEYPLASLMVQAITHSTEHRTQIASIITQLGMEPPDMSGWMYMEETKQYRESAL